MPDRGADEDEDGRADVRTDADHQHFEQAKVTTKGDLNLARLIFRFGLQARDLDLFGHALIGLYQEGS